MPQLSWNNLGLRGHAPKILGCLQVWKRKNLKRCCCNWTEKKSHTKTATELKSETGLGMRPVGVYKGELIVCGIT